MPIRSMTGFARVSRSLPSGELTLTIKTVNHRGLDLHFHMPMDFDAIEPALRAAIRKRVVRGHAQVLVSFKRTAPAAGDSSFAINEAMLQGWLDAFSYAAAKLGLEAQQPDLNQALRLPGMVETRTGSSEPDETLQEETLSAAAEALEELDRFRLREGKAIDAELRARIASIQDLVKRMEEIRSRALPYFQKRLQDRLGEMLAGAHIDPARLAQEAAILAERSDISEELVRLKTHADQTGALISAEGETGKKLDFLLQEMNREANTILSKTGGLGEQGLVLTDLGLAAKAEIDRIREQSLNIE
ncbi:MAG TPA: YicC/YloC family endoribonuclease [Bryobacteraceae bacterium]|nr:YicC/YloC family endoribonuclease [Bryobacteraceae bacterium]